jgi:hypothetical protein
LFLDFRVLKLVRAGINNNGIFWCQLLQKFVDYFLVVLCIVRFPADDLRKRDFMHVGAQSGAIAEIIDFFFEFEGNGAGFGEFRIDVSFWLQSGDVVIDEVVDLLVFFLACFSEVDFETDEGLLGQVVTVTDDLAGPVLGLQ